MIRYAETPQFFRRAPSARAIFFFFPLFFFVFSSFSRRTPAARAISPHFPAQIQGFRLASPRVALKKNVSWPRVHLKKTFFGGGFPPSGRVRPVGGWVALKKNVFKKTFLKKRLWMFFLSWPSTYRPYGNYSFFIFFIISLAENNN